MRQAIILGCYLASIRLIGLVVVASSDHAAQRSIFSARRRDVRSSENTRSLVAEELKEELRQVQQGLRSTASAYSQLVTASPDLGNTVPADPVNIYRYQAMRENEVKKELEKWLITRLRANNYTPSHGTGSVIGAYTKPFQDSSHDLGSSHDDADADEFADGAVHTLVVPSDCESRRTRPWARSQTSSYTLYFDLRQLSHMHWAAIKSANISITFTGLPAELHRRETLTLLLGVNSRTHGQRQVNFIKYQDLLSNVPANISLDVSTYIRRYLRHPNKNKGFSLSIVSEFGVKLDVRNFVQLPQPCTRSTSSLAAFDEGDNSYQNVTSHSTEEYSTPASSLYEGETTTTPVKQPIEKTTLTTHPSRSLYKQSKSRRRNSDASSAANPSESADGVKKMMQSVNAIALLVEYTASSDNSDPTQQINDTTRLTQMHNSTA